MIERMWVEVVENKDHEGQLPPSLVLKATLDKGEVAFPLTHAQAFALTTSLVEALEQL